MASLFWKYVPMKARFYRQLNRLFGLRSLDWQAQSPLPVARRYAKAVTVNDKIYVFGGDEFEKFVDGYLISTPGEAVFEYDMAAKSWSTISTMPTPRAHCSAFRYGQNKICVVGGASKHPHSWGKSNAIEIFDWTTQSWSSGGTIQMPTTLYAAVLIQDRYIYAFGGLGGESSGFNHSNYVYRQDLQENLSSWPGTYAPMPTARNSLVTIVGKDGLIYAMGGMNDAGPLATVEAYDPDTDQWQTKAPMLMPRRNFDAVVGPNGHIYVFGGMSGGAAIAWAEKYDPATDSWIPLPDLPGARMDHTAVVAQDNRIHVIGGQEKESCHADPVFLASVLATTQPVTE